MMHVPFGKKSVWMHDKVYINEAMKNEVNQKMSESNSPTFSDELRELVTQYKKKNWYQDFKSKCLSNLKEECKKEASNGHSSCTITYDYIFDVPVVEIVSTITSNLQKEYGFSSVNANLYSNITVTW